MWLFYESAVSKNLSEKSSLAKPRRKKTSKKNMLGGDAQWVEFIHKMSFAIYLNTDTVSASPRIPLYVFFFITGYWIPTFGILKQKIMRKKWHFWISRLSKVEEKNLEEKVTLFEFPALVRSGGREKSWGKSDTFWISRLSEVEEKKSWGKSDTFINYVDASTPQTWRVGRTLGLARTPYKIL